jgi:hypothetical protein
MATYSVPKRFGLAAILAFTTIFAMVCGVMKMLDAPAVAYWYFGTLGIAVSLAQIASKLEPRLVSVIAGAICLPLFMVIHGFLTDDFLLKAILATPCLAVFGGFVGYLAGAMAAGIFLVADMIETHWRGGPTDHPAMKTETIDNLIPTAVFADDSCTPYLTATVPMTMSDSHEEPRVKALGPPVGVPVYNCIALVSPRGDDGLVHVRAANVSDLRTSGASEREALQHLVGAFKIVISQAVAEGRAVPLLEQPHAKRSDETERLIAVHL